VEQQIKNDFKSAVKVVFTSAFFHVVDELPAIGDWIKEGIWGVTKFTVCLLLLLTFPVSIPLVWWMITKARKESLVSEAKAIEKLNEHCGHLTQKAKREEGDEQFWHD
jgi:hypothetical protein